jgi:hypothetical protein
MTQSLSRIRCFADIPDVLSMEIQPMEYIVPALGIARNTITLWTGADDHAKTFLVQSMALAVAQGSEFLSMDCPQIPVLYLDLENPDFLVQGRLKSILDNEEPTPIETFRYWGIWNQQQPPKAGSELLLTIAKETRPLIIIDPFRYFHTAEENDSTEMSGVMQYLRACAAHGCAVVILHHPAKAEGSTGRGSSAIRGACDLAFLHSLDKESGLITLKVDKNRHGEHRTITIRADFVEGKFEVADSPFLKSRKAEMEKLAQIIQAQPGSTQNTIITASGITPKKKAITLLNEGNGTHWHYENGKNRAKLYFIAPNTSGSVVLSGTNGKDTTLTFAESVSYVPGGSKWGTERRSGISGSSSLDDTTEPLAVPTHKTLPSCKVCGSYALYKDGSCMTCEG